MFLRPLCELLLCNSCSSYTGTVLGLTTICISGPYIGLNVSSIRIFPKIYFFLNFSSFRILPSTSSFRRFDYLSSQFVSPLFLHKRFVYLFHTAIQVVASKYFWCYFSSEKYEDYNHLVYISFKTVPSCNYTLLPATVKVFAIFLEIIL